MRTRTRYGLLACLTVGVALATPIWPRKDDIYGHLYGPNPYPGGPKFAIVSGFHDTTTRFVWFWESDPFRTAKRLAGRDDVMVPLVAGLLLGNALLAWLFVRWSGSTNCDPADRVGSCELQTGHPPRREIHRPGSRKS